MFNMDARKFFIDSYKQRISGLPLSSLFDEERNDLTNKLHAYENMSDEEIVMSLKKESDIEGKETSDYLKWLENYQQEVRNMPDDKLMIRDKPFNIN
jgi:hypothetical protein